MNAIPKWAYEGGFTEVVTVDGVPIAAYSFSARQQPSVTRRWLDPQFPINTAHGSSGLITCPPGLTIPTSGNTDNDGDELGTGSDDQDGCV
jgi:hypothetical protein